MTKTLTLLDDIRNKMTPHMIGLDRDPIWNAVSRFTEGVHDYSTGYPPHNVLAKIADSEDTKMDNDEYSIQLAVAGYSKDQLDVTLENNMLVITGIKSNEDEGNSTEYLYRGISGKNFQKKFQLSDDIKVTGVSLVNGILEINLVREIPEEKKPKSIPIE